MAKNYMDIPGQPRPNWVVSYTAPNGNGVRMCFMCEEKMYEWIEAVKHLNKMSGTEFNYIIEEAID